MSTELSSKSYLFSTDLGFMQAKLSTVVGYDMEDVVRDMAVSQARVVQFINLGKRIDQSKPQGARTLPSIYLNNTEEL